MFDFTNTKPEATVVWKEVNALELKPMDGFTVFQIKFMMYCALQQDFQTMKNEINLMLKAKAKMLPVALLNTFHANAVRKIVSNPLIQDCYRFVEEELHEIYYAIMDYVIAREMPSATLLTWTDRQSMSSLETTHFNMACNKQVGLTMYRLSKGNIAAMAYVRLDNTLPPIPVSSKLGVSAALMESVMGALRNASEGYLDPTNDRIAVPFFYLVPAEVPTVPPSVPPSADEIISIDWAAVAEATEPPKDLPRL